MWRLGTILAIVVSSGVIAGCGASTPVLTGAEFRSLDRSSGREVLDRNLRRDLYYIPPYDTSRIISGYSDCRPRGRRHMGYDFAGVGQHAGLGTPIVSIGRAVVTSLGSPEDDPTRYGRRLRHGSTVIRGDETLPSSGSIPVYGEVWFFTRDYGSSHTGVIVVTELLDGPLAGHQIRYMHMAAVHPALVIGSILERGQELGIMGGTAILTSTPHVHVDAVDSLGRRIDLARYLGIEPQVSGLSAECR